VYECVSVGVGTVWIRLPWTLASWR